MDEFPPIWGFRDARECLAALIAARQRRDPSFSYRQLHRFAGIRTPNYAQLFISGKRNIREDTARKFAEGLSLSPEETEFFVALVRFTQSDDPDERTEYYRQVLELAARHGETAKIDQARLDYFNEWYIPVIHAMASLKGFRADPVWIAARVRPKIRSFDAQRALDVLVHLGILVIEDDGTVRVEEPRLETDD
ncbi:MAG: TIGR02147 family protein, partial [Candidatus Dadabacteria bacterium]